MVEPASTFLMSSLAQPIQAPNSSVTVPTMTTAVLAASDSVKTALLRVTREPPAVTMVAAWINADTGVGPSMASSSQDCKGTCADLPQAASSSSRPKINAAVWPALGMPALTSTKADEPNSASISMTAMDIPMSPTRLTTKAFLAAVAATGLYCQKPINRYDARTTPSPAKQHTRQLR